LKIAIAARVQCPDPCAAERTATAAREAAVWLHATLSSPQRSRSRSFGPSASGPRFPTASALILCCAADDHPSPVPPAVRCLLACALWPVSDELPHALRRRRPRASAVQAHGRRRGSVRAHGL